MTFKEKKRLVDLFLNDLKFQAMAEQDVGWPVKCTVYWDKGIIEVIGPRSGRQLQIQDILNSAKQMDLQ